MNAMRFEYSCAHCGGECDLQASGVPSPTRTTSLVVCQECSAVWQLTVRAELVSGPKPKRVSKCGTVQGYFAHYRDGTVVCKICRDAKNARARETRSR